MFETKQTRKFSDKTINSNHFKELQNLIYDVKKMYNIQGASIKDTIRIIEKIKQSYEKISHTQGTFEDFYKVIKNTPDPRATITALINHYRSQGKIGAEYIKNFAVNPNTNKISEDSQLIEAAKKIQKSSVNIAVPGISASSGFIVNIDEKRRIAYIATNRHCVRDHKGNFKNFQIEILDPSVGNRSIPAKLVNYSNDKDFALLKIKLKNCDLPQNYRLEPLELANSNLSKKGDFVLSVSNMGAFGTQEGSSSFITGKIESFNNNLNIKELDGTITRATNITKVKLFNLGGSSGSAFCNSQGEIIGITNSGVGEISNLIPSNDIKPVINQMIKKDQSLNLTSKSPMIKPPIVKIINKSIKETPLIDISNENNLIKLPKDKPFYHKNDLINNKGIIDFPEGKELRPTKININPEKDLIDFSDQNDQILKTVKNIGQESFNKLNNKNPPSHSKRPPKTSIHKKDKDEMHF